MTMTRLRTRGTRCGEGMRTADALSTSSLSGTALNTESALVQIGRANGDTRPASQVVRTEPRRTATTTIRRLTDEERNLTPEQQKALQEAAARLETYYMAHPEQRGQ